MKTFISLLAMCAACVAGTTINTATVGTLNVGVAAGAEPAPTPDILWWKMNAGSGTALTDSGSNGGAGGGTDADWVTGKSGSDYATDYNGTSHNSFTGTAPSTYTAITFGSDVLTVCGWVYFDATDSARILWESSTDWNGGSGRFVLFLVSGVLRAGITDSGQRAESYTPPSTGSWVHVTAVYDNSTTTGDVKLFFDGAEQTATALTTDTKTASNNFTAQVLYVGGRTSTLFFDGRLDDLRVYSYELSQAQIDAVIADPQ